MLYPGNSACFNTKHLTTISTSGRTACPSEGGMPSCQQLAHSRFPTPPLPAWPSRSPTQLSSAALQDRHDPGARLLADLGRQDRELLSPPPTALL